MFTYVFEIFALESLASQETQPGANLKQVLHELIDNHRVFKYTESNNTSWPDGKKIDVWEALVWTDESCPASKPKCMKVHLLYLDKPRAVSLANRGPGKDDSWEREHVWPKSRGFKASSTHGYTDLHHLRPADRNINNAHNNYGYYDGAIGDAGVSEVINKEPEGNIKSGALLNKDDEWFEPTDAAKGQIARMLFYMDVRYDGEDTDKTGMPDLKIVQGNHRVKEPIIGDLCTLLDWNKRYPVHPIEKQRNNRIEKLQGNRNPFIDYPQFADLIYGDQCTD